VYQGLLPVLKPSGKRSLAIIASSSYVMHITENTTDDNEHRRAKVLGTGCITDLERSVEWKIYSILYGRYLSFLLISPN
jgi:hypothetical protein